MNNSSPTIRRHELRKPGGVKEGKPGTELAASQRKTSRVVYPLDKPGTPQPLPAQAALAAKPSRKDPRVSPPIPPLPSGERLRAAQRQPLGPSPGNRRDRPRPFPVMQRLALPLPRRHGEETALPARDQERRLRRRHLEWGREAAATIRHRIPALGGLWPSGSPRTGPLGPNGAEGNGGCALTGRGGAMIDPLSPQTKREVTPLRPGETDRPLRCSADRDPSPRHSPVLLPPRNRPVPLSRGRRKLNSFCQVWPLQNVTGTARCGYLPCGREARQQGGPGAGGTRAGQAAGARGTAAISGAGGEAAGAVRLLPARPGL